MGRIGALLRDFHDAAPWNLVLGESRWVLIDWDGAVPGSRVWDLAYACHGFIPLRSSTPIATAAALLAELAAGYRLDEGGRYRLVNALERRTLSMYDLLKEGHRTGRRPWSRLWDAGHGSVWLDDARYIEANGDVLRGSLLDATQVAVRSAD